MFHRSLHARTAAVVLATFVSASVPFAAFAQSDKAGAEVLLEQGLKLKSEGKVADGCAKIDASLKLYPSLNTEYHLADCYEKLGKMASAWIDFQEVAEKAKAGGEAAKAQKAAERANAIASKVSKLTIIVAADAPGLEVKRDGVAVSKAILGTPLPLDPGDYAIDASAPGKQPFHAKVTVAPDGSEAKVEIPALADATTTTSTATTPTDATAATTTTTTTSNAAPDTSSSGGGSGMKTAGLIIAGAGVATMAVGGILGLSAKSSFNGASCNGDACDAAGLQQRNDARSKGNVATIVFVVGAAALIGGGVLWLTSPSGSSSSSTSTGSTPTKISAGLTLGGVVVGGSF